MIAYRVATWLSLVELARNKLAMALLAFFVLLWITIARVVFTTEILPVQLQSTGDVIHAGGEKLTMISGAVMSVSSLLGLMMFRIARQSSDFDQRLVADGFPLPALLAAKLTVLVAAAAVVGGYGTLCMLIYWPVKQPLLLAVGLFTGAVVYGTLGLFVGMFFAGELEGIVVLIMVSVIDMVPQNPVANPTPNSAVVPLLPNYGAIQLSTAAGFTHSAVVAPIAYSLPWFFGLTCITFGALTRRTRTRTHTHSAKQPHPTDAIAKAPS